MKQLIVAISSLVALGSNASAQSGIDSIVVAVEKNNTTLTAYRKDADAEKEGNKRGIYLQNPEVSFNYLWGSPTVIGNRKDLSIKQSFDFPTAYGYRRQISEHKNEQVELEYQQQRKAILLQTQLVCTELTYRNALKSELARRLEKAQEIAKSYQKKYEIGDANILEYNKAQVNLLNITKEAEANEIERDGLLAELASLNGGAFIDFKESRFRVQPVASDFEQWYVQAEQNSPVLQWLKQEIAISQKQVKLSTAQSLPKLQAGYMSESVVQQHFQGITVGLTIPLWENKNSVKYAKAKMIAIQSAESDAKLRLYNELKALHRKAIGLQNNIIDYRKSLQQYNSSELLLKAFDKGEISLAEYIYELSLNYESTNRLLELERNLCKTIVELNQYQ